MKRKICILGAGPAGLATAYGLSATQELRDQYDITVYQVGWRAGGKCSTGRMLPENAIDQNCAHYLFGCYDNTFEMVRKIYKELEEEYRTSEKDYPHNPFGKFDDNLLPRDLVALKQRFKGEWHTWLLDFPANYASPGTHDGELLSTGAYIEMIFEWMLEGVFGWQFTDRHNYEINKMYKRSAPPPDDDTRGRVAKGSHKVLGWLTRALLGVSKHRHHKRTLLDKLITGFLKIIRAIGWWFEKNHVEDSLARQQRWSLFDYGCTTVIGLLKDQVLAPGGFEAIDDMDYKKWLKHHGGTRYCYDSPFVELWYQNSLAYPQGDVDNPRMSAAIGLLGQMRACFTYKGNVAFSLQHEIGDTFIGPIYLALQARGVKFNYFHRLRDIEPTADGKALAKITMERQVEMANSAPDSYQPLIDVKGVPSWPNEPDAKQFSEQDRDRYLAGDYNLESFYTTWRGKDFELLPGKDFDEVVFALPHTTIPFYCSKIYETKPAWKDLVVHNPSVESQSLRLWFRPNLKELGWDYPPPIMSGYSFPYCTWEDEGQLAEGQTWPPGDEPQAIACVFGPIAAPEFPPGPEDSDYIPGQKLKALKAANKFIAEEAKGIWPKVSHPDHGPGIDPKKLLKQLSRPNSGPLERYTMTWPGGLKYRLRADESGIEHLYLAGDWVRNGLEAGSIEGATMAGLQASRAISGSPAVIVGERDSYG